MTGNASSRAIVVAACLGIITGFAANEAMRSGFGGRRAVSEPKDVVKSEPENTIASGGPKFELDEAFRRIRNTDPDHLGRVVGEMKSHYAGDSYALAKIAFSESEVHRNITHSLDDQAKSLTRALELVGDAQRQLLLLEMQIRVNRALYFNRKAEREPFISEMKEALALEGKAVPPLYGDIRRDEVWRSAIKEQYVKGCSSLFECASAEELKGFYVGVVVREYLRKEYPEKLAVVAKMSSFEEERHRLAKEWMGALLTGGEFPEGDANTIRLAVRALDDWRERQVNRP